MLDVRSSVGIISFATTGHWRHAARNCREDLHKEMGVIWPPSLEQEEERSVALPGDATKYQIYERES